MSPPRAPSGTGPRFTHSFTISRLYACTWTGTVSSLAASTGTPTSLIERIGSGEMTVRALKLTRFPERFERKRPSLPVRRWTRVLRGRPERCLAGGIPDVWLSKYVVMWYWRSSHRSSTMSWGAPASRFSRSRWLIRRTSKSLWVRSSSERSPDSRVIDGRTVTGGTRRAVRAIPSGRATSGVVPELLDLLHLRYVLHRLLAREEEPPATAACGLEELLDVLHVPDVDHGHREVDVAEVPGAVVDLAAARLASQAGLDDSKMGVHEAHIDGEAVVVVRVRRDDLRGRHPTDLVRTQEGELDRPDPLRDPAHGHHLRSSSWRRMATPRDRSSSRRSLKAYDVCTG